ncbi:MAG: T9SS type A sorting domain-containing protein, partial [Flavobacteriales bacterium]|nr:T9SS type A sorting domain-containing protein [Flavobacteriales bacterium]
LSGGNVGILDLGQFIKINAWPNPVEDVLHIQIPENESEISQIEIINLSGQIIQVIPTNGNSGLFEMNTTELSPGIYFYSVANGTNRITGRFIVK